VPRPVVIILASYAGSPFPLTSAGRLRSYIALFLCALGCLNRILLPLISDGPGASAVSSGNITNRTTPCTNAFFELEGVGCDQGWLITLEVTCTFRRAQRRQHLARGQVARRHLHRVEPDPQRVVARAEQPHVAHVVEPG
jgi:hypothetical protein